MFAIWMGAFSSLGVTLFDTLVPGFMSLWDGFATASSILAKITRSFTAQNLNNFNDMLVWHIVFSILVFAALSSLFSYVSLNCEMQKFIVAHIFKKNSVVLPVVTFSH